MKTDAVSAADLCGVFAVPPLVRRRDAHRTLDHEQKERTVRHVVAGGIKRLLYGGNAFVYHLTLGESYQELLGSLAAVADDTWIIPAIGPSFGRAIDQAPSCAGMRFRRRSSCRTIRVSPHRTDDVFVP